MTYWTIPRLGREYYRVEIITVPQLTNWEISIDHGVNWHTMSFDTDTNEAMVLVAGPDFVPVNGDTTDFVQVPNSVMPYLRAIDNPEVIVRSTPRIDVV